MNSKDFRTSSILLRNSYPITKISGMPIINHQCLMPIDAMLSFHDVRGNDKEAIEKRFLVHFFKNDDCFEYLYHKAHTKRAVAKLMQLAQYTAVCTPDFSLYPEMPLPVQQNQVFMSRWCGAHWQAQGLTVFPTVTWADESSFSFCFDGVPQHSTVVVSTVGCHQAKKQFLAGYEKMLEILQPQSVICYGKAFDEMEGNIIVFPYSAFRKGRCA